LGEEQFSSVLFRLAELSFAALLEDGSWSTQLWPDPSFGNGVADQTAKSVEELVIVRAQLPKRVFIVRSV